MNLRIREINNKGIWENFLLECQEKTFLDSWNWGEFQKREGERIWRLGIYDTEQLIACALVIKIKARRGTFLFVPHGPNIISNSPGSSEARNSSESCFLISKQKVLEVLLRELKKIAKTEKASFIRIAPIWERNEENIKIFENTGFRKAPIHMHPEATLELDVRTPEEKLLMGMRKTTRYLIRQAQKNNDIKISQSQDVKDLELFDKIYQETAQRHHFVPFSLKYLENQFSSFLKDSQISIFLGRYKGKVVSSAIVVFWQNIGFYHHGASLLKYNKIPVSYLLQWETIKEVKKRGCQFYNFWGIAPEITDKSKISGSRHPWAGLTLFKMGFGGYRKEYLKTQDFPLSAVYWLTFIFEKMRKTKRGL